MSEHELGLEPIPPGHGEGTPDVLDPLEPVPVCPACGGMLRRLPPASVTGDDSVRDFSSRGRLRCDIHGVVAPELAYPSREEDE